MQQKVPYKLSLICLLIASPPTNSLTTNQSTSYPNGFSLGAGVGVTSFMTNTFQHVSAANTSDVEKNLAFKYGAMGNIFLGYNKKVRDKYYLGGELGLNLLGATTTSLTNTARGTAVVTDAPQFPTPITFTVTTVSSLSTTTTVSSNSLVPTLDIKPGLFLSPEALLFAKIGMSYNQMVIKSNASYQETGTLAGKAAVKGLQTATSSSDFSNSHTSHLIGLRTGLGFEYLLTEHVGVGANYLYTFYNTAKMGATSASNQVACDTYEGCVVNNKGTYTTAVKSTMSDQEVMLQLIYHFA